METVCHPIDDQELLFLRSALTAAKIPYVIVGEGFGSLFPGMQVADYNERSIRVPPEFAAAALEVVENVREDYMPASTNLRTRSKLRMLLEAIVFGWVVPGGTRRTPNRSLDDEAR